MKNTTRIKCHSFIEAEWNFFSNRAEAIAYFNTHCIRIPNANYEVVDIVYYSYPL